MCALFVSGLVTIATRTLLVVNSTKPCFSALQVQQQELEKERLTSADLGRQCEAWQAEKRKMGVEESKRCRERKRCRQHRHKRCKCRQRSKQLRQVSNHRKSKTDTGVNACSQSFEFKLKTVVDCFC